MERAQRNFVDRMGLATESDGLSPIAGRLFALLLLANEPKSLDELATALDVSKASVSTDARRLLERGIAERVTRAGDRRDYYELAPDFFVRIVQSRVNRWRRIQTLADDLRGQAAELPPDVRERIDSIDDVQNFVIERLEQALAEWEQRTHETPPRSRTRKAASRS
jgi:DNA-binding transcriptional regulator GbsR (MarR family)